MIDIPGLCIHEGIGFKLEQGGLKLRTARGCFSRAMKGDHNFHNNRRWNQGRTDSVCPDLIVLIMSIIPSFSVFLLAGYFKT